MRGQRGLTLNRGWGGGGDPVRTVEAKEALSHAKNWVVEPRPGDMIMCFKKTSVLYITYVIHDNYYHV